MPSANIAHHFSGNFAEEKYSAVLASNFQTREHAISSSSLDRSVGISSNSSRIKSNASSSSFCQNCKLNTLRDTKEKLMELSCRYLKHIKTQLEEAIKELKEKLEIHINGNIISTHEKTLKTLKQI